MSMVCGGGAIGGLCLGCGDWVVGDRYWNDHPVRLRLPPLRGRGIDHPALRAPLRGMRWAPHRGVGIDYPDLGAPPGGEECVERPTEGGGFTIPPFGQFSREGNIVVRLLLYR